MLCKWFFLEDFLSTNVRFHKFGQHWRFPTGLLSGKWQLREALTFLNSQSTILNYQIHSIQCNLHDHEDRFWSHFHTLDTICAPIPAPSASWRGGVYISSWTWIKLSVFDDLEAQDQYSIQKELSCSNEIGI